MAEGFDVVIVGAGFAGAVAARELAERAGKKVLIVEQHSHIAGNCYDCLDDAGVLIHKYGPHIFHTSDKRAWDFLCRFTKWSDYRHRVVANVHGKIVPVPFNLDSLNIVFDAEKAQRLEKRLVELYGMETKVPILELRRAADPEVNELAEYVYENIFLRYTMKQWGKEPHELDPEVTGRVPVFVSREPGYFPHDTWQGMPVDGYTKLVERMLDHPSITVRLNTKAEDVIEIDGSTVKFEGKPFTGTFVFTGQLDELFGLRFGRLPYRTLDFEFETHDVDQFQVGAVVNYTVDMPYTRITEFKHMTEQVVPGKTSIVREFSRAYTGGEEIPYYAVANNDSLALYDQYMELAKAVPNMWVIGRLAEFKYYNIDGIVARSLEVSDKMIDSKA